MDIIMKWSERYLLRKPTATNSFMILICIRNNFLYYEREKHIWCTKEYTKSPKKKENMGKKQNKTKLHLTHCLSILINKGQGYPLARRWKTSIKSYPMNLLNLKPPKSWTSYSQKLLHSLQVLHNPKKIQPYTIVPLRTYKITHHIHQQALDLTKISYLW